MRPFHTIAIPHDDILKGRLTMDVFAADLWDVSQNQGVDEYKNAEIFFKKTYLTYGLKNLLDIVEKRLKGKGGDPVIQIQTPFGGGKTHALIAMYHKAKEWGAKTAVIVGTHHSTDETLWGLIEKQLTGRLEICNGKVAPGSEKIKMLLKENQPVLILMDEVLEYTTKAAGEKIGDSTLAAQTLAFIQELTEAVGTLEKVSLVLTLPASGFEHYDESAEKLFQQLQHVTGRTEKIYTPVEENEISRIIRRRLFSDINLEEASKIALSFSEYAEKENILQGNIKSNDYYRRFIDSYPFMPDVIDVLYQRWGSFHDFQRTRGVLRLLSLVVYDLKEASIPYISLSDFNLDNQEIRRELLKYIGNEFDSIISSDITAPNSGAAIVNNGLGKANLGYKYGTRAATAIFLHSFSAGPERGVGINGTKRSAAVYPNPSNVVGEAVGRLKDKLFYLQVKDDRYYFSNQPNLNRIILSYTENVSDQEIPNIERELLISALKKDIFKVYVWEEDSSNIADSEELKLVILREKKDKVINEIFNNKGQNPRVNKNTIFIVYPVESERSSFNKIIKNKIALETILKDKSINLTDEQREELNKKIKGINDSLKELIRKLYRLVAIPSKDGYKEIDIGSPITGVNYYIDQDLFEELKINGDIIEKFSPLVIKDKYLKEKEYVLTAMIYKSSLTTRGEVRFLSKNVLEDSIKEGVSNGLFGLGELVEDKPECIHFKKTPPVYLSGSEIIIDSKICEEQKAKETVEYPEGGGSSGGDIIKDGGGSGPETPALQGVKEYNHLYLEFNIPKGRVHDIMVMVNFIQSKFDNLKIALTASNGLINENEIENNIKETFMQLGINDYRIEKSND